MGMGQDVEVFKRCIPMRFKALSVNIQKEITYSWMCVSPENMRWPTFRAPN